MLACGRSASPVAATLLDYRKPIGPDLIPAIKTNVSLAPSRSCVRQEHTTPQTPWLTRCRCWTRLSAESPAESARNDAGVCNLLASASYALACAHCLFALPRVWGVLLLPFRLFRRLALDHC